MLYVPLSQSPDLLCFAWCRSSTSQPPTCVPYRQPCTRYRPEVHACSQRSVCGAFHRPLHLRYEGRPQGYTSTEQESAPSQPCVSEQPPIASTTASELSDARLKRVDGPAHVCTAPSAMMWGADALPSSLTHLATLTAGRRVRAALHGVIHSLCSQLLPAATMEAVAMLVVSHKPGPTRKHQPDLLRYEDHLASICPECFVLLVRCADSPIRSSGATDMKTGPYAESCY